MGGACEGGTAPVCGHHCPAAVRDEMGKNNAEERKPMKFVLAARRLGAPHHGNAGVPEMVGGCLGRFNGCPVR